MDEMSSEYNHTTDPLVSKVLELTKKIKKHPSPWLDEVTETSETLIQQYLKKEITKQDILAYIGQIDRNPEEIIEIIRVQTLDGHGRYFFKPKSIM